MIKDIPDIIAEESSADDELLLLEAETGMAILEDLEGKQQKEL